MTVKIVTDSTADLPPKIAEELEITVVPLFVRFGNEIYRDGVEITADEFYDRLVKSTVFPATAAPPPGAFKETYQRLAPGSDGIVSIHVSSKLSGTFESAMVAKRELGDRFPVEVVDSRLVTMALGVLVIAAAKAARKGASIAEILKLVEESIPKIRLLGIVDKLEFLQRGGRIGKAQQWMGSLLSVKPILCVRDGEVSPLERVRTRAKAIERIYALSSEMLPAREIGVMYSTEKAEADKLLEHIQKQAPGQPVYMARFGPVLGTYVGPDCLAVVSLK